MPFTLIDTLPLALVAVGPTTGVVALTVIEKLLDGKMVPVGPTLEDVPLAVAEKLCDTPVPVDPVVDVVALAVIGAE